MKKIAILGSTGSIGDSTLKVVRHLGPERFQVVALAAHSQIDLLEQQAREFQPELIAVYNRKRAQELQQRLPHIKVVGGEEGIDEVASHSSAQMVISAMSGTVGLKPTLAAIIAGKDVALANKESLVSAGSLVMELARQKNVRILPIDSEHSALFQCLNGEDKQKVRRLILTASGGPFRTMNMHELHQVTVDQALQHPTWRMGPKVTIDCSTLMNKGLEVIEAHWLFDIPIDKIEVVIHPQSLVHSFVEFVDSSLLAQVSVPSMTLPIQYAMTYPERLPGLLPPFDFLKNGHMQFFQPDKEKFRCLDLAFHAAREGGSLPCYMNAANEVLVNRFIGKAISWPEIGQKLESLMARHGVGPILHLEDVASVEAEARAQAEQI